MTPPYPPGSVEATHGTAREQTSRHFTAKMTSFPPLPSVQHLTVLAGSLEQTNRVKLPLLKILQAAGALGKMLTVKEPSLRYAKKNLVT